MAPGKRRKWTRRLSRMLGLDLVRSATAPCLPIVLVAILLIGFFSLDYYQDSSSIIKDRNFRGFIKKEYGIKGRIEKEDLRGIEELFIDNDYHVRNIEGIEHFEDVKTLYIWDGKIIKDFKPIAKLHKLKEFVVWDADVDKLKEIPKMESVEWIEIVFPKAGEINSLENFPNLKQLDVY